VENMSVKDIELEIENLSNNFEKLLNKARTSEEKVEVFSTYYKMLLFIEKIKIDELKGKQK
jgi:glycyl-tRNA synthetase beta subunit